MDFSKIESSLYGDVEDDDDLLAELMALENEGKRKVESSTQKRSAGRTLDPRALSAALAEIPDDDGEMSDAIEDDEELLGELADLLGDDQPEAVAPPPLPSRPARQQDDSLLHKLREVESEYKKMKADAAGNTSKIRRYDRALAKISDLIEKAEKGIKFDLSEIPPSPSASAAPQSSSEPVPPSAPVRSSSTEQPPRELPRKKEVLPPPVPPRKEEPQRVHADSSSSSAAPAKPDGGLQKEVLLSLLQRRKQAYIKNAHLASKAEDKAAALEFVAVAKQFDEAIKAVNSGVLTECDESEIPPTPPPYRIPPSKMPPPKTISEDLQRRVEVFIDLSSKYKAEDNERKLRMNSRIIENYQEAMREIRAGRPFDLSELPPPPGFEKLASRTALLVQNVSATPMAAARPLAAVDPRSGGPPSRQQNQLQFLLTRQKQFKDAAILAKKRGDVITAKKYLLSAKGFEPMIEASHNGLPVDIRKAPIPPQVLPSQGTLKPTIESQKSLTGNESALIAGDTREVFASMERDLIRQVKLCDNNRTHFAKLGDVSRVKLYESMLSSCKRDLLQIRSEAANGNVPPRFRYVIKEFPCVEMNADMPPEVARVVIVGADEVKLPSGYKPTDGNIYVAYDFPFPHDSHQTGKTKLVSGTDSPRFNETVDFNVNRKSRQLLRVIKRSGIKFEVYQKGGFLRSDKLLGTTEFKINDLENKATIDGIVALMDGRKPAGGRLAVNVKVREPLGETALKVIKEKWLVIEQ
ncbi:hypothetical protein QR680_009332 [Steinernema hermaphroditum]|uniref:C2 domain-containing protein n=1 Tax=Steinernema hermaphroditum TaxID=289476 RepID=A0AA39IMC3_9BILA|nr:hypothetical protein QR680_009332 [Steinernema hermaphroditum]